MQPGQPSWQSTVIALALIILVGVIFLAVFWKEGVDSALKVWGAVGTLVGVITGAVPTYFFSRATSETLRERSEELRERADTAERKVEAFEMTNSEIAAQAREKYPHLFGPTSLQEDDQT